MNLSQYGNWRCRSDVLGHFQPRRALAGAAERPPGADTLRAVARRYFTSENVAGQSGPALPDWRQTSVCSEIARASSTSIPR